MQEIIKKQPAHNKVSQQVQLDTGLQVESYLNQCESKYLRIT